MGGRLLILFQGNSEGWFGSAHKIQSGDFLKLPLNCKTSIECNVQPCISANLILLVCLDTAGVTGVSSEETCMGLDYCNLY